MDAASVASFQQLNFPFIRQDSFLVFPASVAAPETESSTFGVCVGREAGRQVRLRAVREVKPLERASGIHAELLGWV